MTNQTPAAPTPAGLLREYCKLHPIHDRYRDAFRAAVAALEAAAAKES